MGVSGCTQGASLRSCDCSAVPPRTHYPPPPTPAHLLDALVQQAQLVCGGCFVHQRQLGDQAVDAGQEAVHPLHALGGPHLQGSQAGTPSQQLKRGLARKRKPCLPAPHCCPSTRAEGSRQPTMQPHRARPPTLVSLRGPMNISYRRSESAPYCHTTSSGLMTLPRLLLILWAREETLTAGSDLST